ncbi:sulfatase [bacterium]|nr:sulfatase [bacterium]
MKFPVSILSLVSVVCIANAADKPNIIYLMADDQNFNSVGIYGNSDVQTPHMDKLGQDGLIFDKHYNTTAICMASRANVFTGMYEYKTGTNFQHSHMKPEIWAKSYPVLLREAGYMTAFAGKFGLDIYGLGAKGKKVGMPEGDFDMWGGAPGQTQYATKKNAFMAKYAEKYPHSTLSYGAFGQDVIREAVKANKPFCLSISFKAPHRPTTPDPQFDHIYAGKTFTKPANYGREHADHLSPQSKTGRQWVRFSEWGYDKKYDKVMATYYQQIYAIDVALGMIREELEAQGVADNTVIIYTSDNGFLCGAHGYGSKVLPLEDSARAPLMIYDPRSPNAGKGQRTKALTGNIDFAPTILELAGLPTPENMDGKSLLPVLKKPEDSHHTELAFMNLYGDVPTKSLTVMTEEVKYTYWWYGDKTMEPAEDLFHLGKDPLELTNLAKNPEAKPLLEKMRKQYDQRLEHWTQNAESAYAQYGTLFDRDVAWDTKQYKNGDGVK